MLGCLLLNKHVSFVLVTVGTLCLEISFDKCHPHSCRPLREILSLNTDL